MSETLQIIIYLTLALGIAVGFHAMIKRYLLASFLAAITMILVMLVIEIAGGQLDKLWIIGAISGFVVASIFSLIIGLPFKLKRKSRAKASNKSLKNGTREELRAP